MKPQQKKKPGRVLRADPVVQRFIESQLHVKESLTACLRRLLGLPSKRGEKPKRHYVLPSDLFPSVELARGHAIMRAVKTKKPEKPIEVRVG